MELKDRLKQLRLDSKKTQKEVAQSLGRVEKVILAVYKYNLNI